MWRAPPGSCDGHPVVLDIVVALSAVASGPGFPAFDAGVERVLAGSGPAYARGGSEDAAGGACEQARTHGVFSVDGGALRLQAPAAYGESTWVCDARVDDGVARMKIHAGTRTDVSLLLRAKAAAPCRGPASACAHPGGPRAGELEEGYAVTVDDTRGRALLKLSRFEHGVPRLLGAEARIPGFRSGADTELVVVAAGPFLSATLYDADTLAPRAHVEVHDGRARAGGVGVRFGKRSDAAVTLLSAGPVRSSTTAARDGGGHTGGAGDVDEDAGAGAERLVIFPPAQRPRVPRGLHAYARGDAAAVLTDPVGLERLLRAGVVPLEVHAQIPWMDEDAELRAHLGQPPKKTARGFVIDESYKDADMVAALLHGYAERYPGLTRLEQIGTTTDGRALWALAIGEHIDGDVDTVLLDGAHHGGELMSIEVVLDAVQQLLEHPGDYDDVLERVTVWCVPLVNVDGNMRYIHDTRDYDRKNGRDVDENGRVDGWDGVDLYRNYPADWGGLGEVGSRSNPFHYRYRGPAAGSEPEPQAMMKLAARERFTASIDFHTNATAILVPYTDPDMKSPEPNEAWDVAEEVARGLPVQINGKRYTVRRNLYAVDGTFQDWLRETFGTVALLVEGPENNPLPYARHRGANVAGTRGTWQHLLLRTVRGPGVAGHVRGDDGAPLEAQVSVDEQQAARGERWTSRPRDGRFHRLLPAGTYTLRARAAGYADKTARVVIKPGKTAVVELVLSR